MPTTTSWIAVNDGSGMTISPLYFAFARSDQVRGRSASATLSVRTGIPTSCRRWATHRPSRSLAAAPAVVNPAGREGLEDAWRGGSVGGAGVRQGEHVGARRAGAEPLLQPPQHRLSARAQELHLDPGLLLERVR